MTVDLSSYGNTTTTYGLATDEGLANEEQRRRMETEAAMSEQYNATRASWLGNWTAGTGELTGKVLDNDLDFESLLPTPIFGPSNGPAMGTKNTSIVNAHTSRPDLRSTDRE